MILVSKIAVLNKLNEAANFLAYRNSALIGFSPELVAFDKKSKRDEFCRKEKFEPVSLKQAKQLFADRQIAEARRYPTSIVDDKGHLIGLVFWTYGGTYDGIEWQ